MIFNFLKKAGLPLFLLLFILVNSSALDIYVGNLGYGNFSNDTASEVQELSSLIQEQLTLLSNDAVRYYPLYSADEIARDYNETIVDSKLSALAACIFYNVSYVLFGSIYVDMSSNLYTTFIKVYDNTKKNILYETNYSKVINNRNKMSYAHDMTMLVNNEIFTLLTGRPYITPGPTRTPVATPSGITPMPTPRVSGKNPPPVLDEPSASGDEGMSRDIKKILGIVEDLNTKIDKVEKEEQPQTDKKETADDESLWDSWNSGTGNTGADDTWGKETDSAKSAKKGRQYLSFNAGGGYLFTFSGKWLNPVVPLFTVEESMKLRMYLVDTEYFKFLMRQSTSLNYTYYRQSPDNLYNYYIQLHAIKARLGLDFYLEFGKVFAFYLGGGAFYARNAVDFRTALHYYYADTHYALGAYGDAGIEILFGNLGIGIDDIFDITFFDTWIMDDKVMLFITIKV